ncbi:uncharacterized protein [Henckelia pumila]|uniref:uncharacterized protein n=1 Tax=Henckelia pumila TaxID=405737 RepID=UPI003C6DFFE8
MTQRINVKMNHLHRIIHIGDVECVVNLRMNRNNFSRFCYLLTHVGGLVESRYVCIEEKVAMFLLNSLMLMTLAPTILGNGSRDGALEGTYVSVHVPTMEKTRYRTRKDTIAVNVLRVCDHDMKFIYALMGWEGSTSDPRVLRDAFTGDDIFKVSRGEYVIIEMLEETVKLVHKIIRSYSIGDTLKLEMSEMIPLRK